MCESGVKRCDARICADYCVMAVRRESSLQIISETFRDFTKHTSIHGLKYVCQKNLLLAERIFWAIATLVGIGLAVYMTTLFWGRYTSNPTRTTIKTLHAPTIAIPFPAVTLCNENVVIGSKVQEFIRSLKYDNNSESDLEDAFLELEAFTNPKKISWNEESMKQLNKVLNENNYDLAGTMAKVGQNCNELFVKCQWNFQNVNCTDLFLDSYTKSGMCCTFYGFGRNKNKQTFTDNYGTEGTLSVIVNPLIEPNKFTEGSRGLRVLLHNSLSYPDFRALKKIISTGTQTHLQIIGTRIMCSAEVARLSIEQRECVFPGEVRLKYFKTYTDANCLIERETDELMRICRCVPYYFHFSETDSVEDNEESCPSPCEDSLYEVKSTHVKLEKGDFYHIKEADNMEHLEEHTTHLKIYFVKFQKVLRRDLLFSTASLMASVGGIYSLFIGCSFLTICEIIYYCTLRLIVNKHLSGKYVDSKQ
ncbi:hypothetical protein HHI36_000010 [Cryptolaemus montrouzieri]|uniref:Sodium channel protein Nach n=1 Tax=Cryptolaemus montrouzieri TaxID=559131 RepID=A0ABD2P3B5_9CUCU